MNARLRILLGGILTFILFVVGIRARAIPDFTTDEDLNEWHKFGLRSFLGPWSVIARKPNGDLVSYADYGARIPSDYRPISGEVVDTEDENDTSSGLTHYDQLNVERQYPSKYATGLSDFGATYGWTNHGLAVFSRGIQPPIPEVKAPSPTQGHSKDTPTTLRSLDDLEKFIKSDDEDKSRGVPSIRDYLELLGMVGVVSKTHDDISGEKIIDTEIATTSTENIDDPTTVTNDPSLNVTS